MPHFADRLCEAVQAKGTPLCVGLDPRWESLSEAIRTRHGPTPADRGRAYEEFCCRVLDIVAPLVGVVKPQSAFFEACGSRGMQALRTIIKKARQLGLMAILDAKRNDIASTAEAYAEAAFRFYDADALTVNPYLGRDSIEPFLKIGRPLEKGLFILVRTSNKGAGQFQDLDSGGRPIYSHVACAVSDWSREHIGSHGFGDVGAVVGATSPAELKSLRSHMPEVLFLVPGYGAQGASAADTSGAFREDGLGAIVNSSRGILFPYEPSDPNWERLIEQAARQAVAELAARTPAWRLQRTGAV